MISSRGCAATPRRLPSAPSSRRWRRPSIVRRRQRCLRKKGQGLLSSLYPWSLLSLSSFSPFFVTSGRERRRPLMRSPLPASPPGLSPAAMISSRVRAATHVVFPPLQARRRPVSGRCPRFLPWFCSPMGSEVCCASSIGEPLEVHAEASHLCVNRSSRWTSSTTSMAGGAIADQDLGLHLHKRWLSRIHRITSGQGLLCFRRKWLGTFPS